MKHLITGGSGFLGNLIAKRLLADGEDVSIVDLWEDAQRSPKIKYTECDIRNREKLSSLMKGIDVVHHTAALVPLTKSGKQFDEVNVEGCRIVAEEAVKNHVRHLVHMSSSAIYGLPEDNPITDKTKCEPIEIYGKSKWAGEQAVEKVCREAGLPLIIIRPRTILGEGRLGIFQILFDWIREGRKIYVIGDGNINFQFVHASDLIEAYMLAIRSGKPGAYNVGTPYYGTLRNALEKLIETAGTKSRVVGLPAKLTIASLNALDALGLSPLAPWHYLTYHKPFCFDVSKLLELGWKPEYSNDKMLAESYQWFCEHDDESRRESKGSAHRNPVKQKLLGILKKIS